MEVLETLSLPDRLSLPTTDRRHVTGTKFPEAPDLLVAVYWIAADGRLMGSTAEGSTVAESLQLALYARDQGVGDPVLE